MFKFEKSINEALSQLLLQVENGAESQCADECHVKLESQHGRLNCCGLFAKYGDHIDSHHHGIQQMSQEI